jgi:hypothetical protein
LALEGLQHSKGELDRFLVTARRVICSCVIAAANFDIFFRFPFSVMTTGFVIASDKIVAKFRVPLPRPFGLPD